MPVANEIIRKDIKGGTTYIAKLPILVMVCLLVGIFGGYAQGESQFDVKVLVSDEKGAGVADAQAEFIWRWSGLRSEGSGHLKAKTDKTGQASFTGKTNFKEYAYKASKNGFYPSDAITGVFDTQSDGKWEPWEKELKVILRPVKKPVPMYVKTIQGQLPMPGQWSGYDLKEGDWVTPHGQGKVSDIEIKAKGEGVRYENFRGEITLRFPGTGNGILVHTPSSHESQSTYTWPYEAPVSGYIREMTWKKSRTPNPSGNNKVDHYDEANNPRHLVIRVRGSLYGKIDPELKLVTGVKGQAFIKFTYYLNPDKTRNLEYDPARNLFGNSSATYAP
jgi:hypothetical protein